MLARGWHAAIAAAVLAGVVLQIVIAVRVSGTPPSVATGLLRGSSAIWKWYPYPFVDVASHGYLRVALNAVLVTVVLGLVAALFAVGDARLPAAPPVILLRPRRCRHRVADSPA